MSDARIEFSLGDIHFSGEGTETWLEKQLDKLLLLAPTIKTMTETPAAPPNIKNRDGKVEPLALFLKQKNVAGNQNRRFLAAAVWLKLSGISETKTSLVVKALADAQQQRLGNPSDILNQNVAKGFCVKQGDGFYVTPEGEAEIG